MPAARDNRNGGSACRPHLQAGLAIAVALVGLTAAQSTAAQAAPTQTAARRPADTRHAAVGPAAAGGAATRAAEREPSVLLCAGYGGCLARGHSDHGYPAHAGASFWRMTAGNECTNYVAYVESRVFHVRAPSYLLGNAGQWAATAAAHGVVVNHAPAVGAVAEWDGGAPGMGPEGHVAVVEQVGPDHRFIVISQQHMGYSANGYDWTRINAGFPAGDWQEWPDHFLHFRLRGRHRLPPRVGGSARPAEQARAG
jgi:surface antigen